VVSGFRVTLDELDRVGSEANPSSFAHHVQKPSEFARFESILASIPSRRSALAVGDDDAGLQPTA
jgi:hypothetical protein